MKRFHRGGKPPTPKPAPPPKGTQHIPKPPPAPKPQPKPAPKPPPAPSPPSKVDIIKGNILQLLSAADGNSVDTRAAVGDMIRNIKAELPHGTFASWIEAELPWKANTAQRAIKLHDFKQREPAMYEKIRPLGVAKAYVLITYPIAKIESIVSSAHTVPSKKHHKVPVQMSQDEMMEVISALSNKTPTAADDPLIKRFRRNSSALRRAIRDLIADRATIDPDDLEDAYDDLRAALAQLARAFPLDGTS